jgi:general secretion pathway protein F
MAVFEYKALSKATGKTVSGVIDADNAATARRKLRDQDLYPTFLSAGAESGATGTALPGAGRMSRGRVSVRDIAMMTRQLSVLLRAGMPVVEALNAMVDQTSKQRLRMVIFDVREKVNGGRGLGDALAEHPRVFSALYVNMVRAGESSGALEQVLIRLADILERNAKLRSQITSTLAYPAFMGCFAFAIIVFLMTVIVPRITKLFQKQEQELPKLTKAMIGVSDFIGHWWFLIIGAVFLILFVWRLWVSRDAGRRTWDRMKMRFPLYGPLHQKLASARFTRTLGIMLQSGLTMLPALEVVNTVIDNRHILSTMDEVKAGVRRGRDLAQPLKETGLFPPMMIHMIELGQRSGELESMLVQVADTFDEDVRLTIDAIVALIEPAIIIVMGVFVGTLVLAILLPIFQMSTNIGGGH